MTFTEREEKGNSSNTKLVEIKKEKVEEEEEEEDIELWLNEVLKDSDSIDDELQIGASSSQNHIDKAPINEEEEDAEESERSTKRTRTTESDEAESMINKATNVEEDETEWGMDPLEVTEEIVLKYHDSFPSFLFCRCCAHRLTDAARQSLLPSTRCRAASTDDHTSKRIE